MSTAQKVAIITGASQGIGAALVTAYRKLGYRVVAVSRSIQESGDPEILAIPADLSPRHIARDGPAGVEKLARARVGQFGGAQAAQQERGGHALGDEVQHRAVGGGGQFAL